MHLAFRSCRWRCGAALIMCTLAGCGARAPIIGPYESGRRAMDRHDYGAAEAIYSRAISLSPEDCGCWNGRAYARVCAGNYTGAIEDSTRAIELNPRYSKAYGSRGMARSRGAAMWTAPADVAGADWDGAIADFDKVIEINESPSLVGGAFASRAIVHALRHDFGAALADADRVAAIDPSPVRGPALRAGIQVRKGDEAAAKIDVEAVRRLSAKGADALERDLERVRRVRGM
jgi:tetratricopeptide (TPR) repeat protein